MKNTHSGLLAALTGIAILGGCASTTPTTPVASSSQSGSSTQSTAGNASTSGTSAVSTIQSSNSSMVKPTASTVYFEYDSFAVGNQYANVVRSNADYLVKANDAMQLDGNADERGSREYNMALGQKRAEAVKRALTALGAKSERIDTVSYGEDKPKANGRDEAAYAENRRVDFVPKAK